MARGRSFLAVPVGYPERDREADDYRPVPASDRGDGYSDRGALGGYSPSREPFASPSDVRRFAGYGASEADLARGFVEPGIREDPAYDAANYRQRSTDPRVADEDQGNTMGMPDDWEFRQRNTRSRGFLTRPRTPSER